MKMKLTELAVQKVGHPAKGQITYWDESTPGFGLRCSTRSKSFVVVFGPNRKLLTLGRHPELSLQVARHKAKKILVQETFNKRRGIPISFENAVSTFLDDCASRLRKKSVESYGLYLNSFRLAGSLSNLSKQDFLSEIGKFNGRPSSQNNAFTAAKVFLNWAVRNDHIEFNPLHALKRPNPPATRNRVLSDLELKTLLQHTMANRDRFNDIVTVLAVTGQRRGEVSQLEWSDVDGDFLDFPGSKTKNRRSHRVPMSRFASNVINASEGNGRYIFADPVQMNPFSAWTRGRNRLNRETGLSGFTLHDLRRTYSTIHARIGTPIHVTERLLNHVTGSISGVAAIYNRHSYEQEMRTAVIEFDNFIGSLID